MRRSRRYLGVQDGFFRRGPGDRPVARCGAAESGVDRHPYLREISGVKTTIEIQDRLFREAKTVAASRGLSLKRFLTEALREKLSAPRRSRRTGWPVPPPRLAKGEMRRVQSTIDAEFSRIEAEAWT